MAAERRREVFELLTREGFNSHAKWDKVSQSEPFKALVESVSDRKQLLAEFINFAKNRENEESYSIFTRCIIFNG